MIHRYEWWQLCVPLVVGTSLLQPKSVGRAGLAGLVPALLGSAAMALDPAGSRSYVAVSNALMLVGGTLPLMAAARALRGPPPAPGRSLPGALLMLGGTGAIGLRAAPIVAATGLQPVLAWALSIIAGWWALLLLGRLIRLRHGAAWLDRTLLARDPPAPLQGTARVPRAGAGLLLGGGLLVFAGSHAGLVIGGMLLASVGAELVFRRGTRRAPVLLVVTLALVPVYWLLHTVAGPIGLGLGTLDQIPVSPAAARLVALPLGLVAWAWLGLWPLHGVVSPVLLAPLGAALWLRLAAPVAADGLVHWQPLFVTLAVAGLWHAAAGGRLASVFVGLAFAALGSIGPSSVAAATLLLGAAVTLKLPRPARGAALIAFDALRRLGLAASAIGAMLGFAAGLRAEIVLTVLAAAGLVYGYRTASPVNDL